MSAEAMLHRCLLASLSPGSWDKPALLLGGLCACVLLAQPGCVPRERPEEESAPPGPAPKIDRASRTAAVASREEVPEDLPSNTVASPVPSASSTATGASSQVAVGQNPTPDLRSVPADNSSLDTLLTKAFVDSFDRIDLGDDWRSTSDQWRTEGGRLCVSNARNHPLWLRRRLPPNARIEFNATSYSDDGDIKVEIWGDGRSAARGASYNDATGYLAILGGWRNQFHVLARLDEHAPDRPEIKLSDQNGDPRAWRVDKGTEYHFKIERADGKTVRWLVDDIEMFAFADPAPLAGSGHDHFGFNNWQVRVCFDDLKILPLPSP